MVILRLLLLCLSMFGYVLFLNKKCRIDLAFAPALSVSFILVAVFLSGIVGILSWIVYVLLALGAALFVWMLVQKPATNWKAILTNPALIFLTVCAIYLFIRFNNRVLYSYDDFSHWGTIVKTMLLSNALPNADNSFLMFQSYPPGSACWIYFVARILGAKEGLYFFAQGMLALSFLATMFSFYGKRPKVDLLFPVVGSVLLYTYVLDPNCLGVDALLATAGLAAALAVYRYRKSLTKRFLFILPLVCTPLLIKNSGVFFSLLPVLLGFYYLNEQKKPSARKKWIAAIALVVVPLLVLLLWRQHVATAFDTGLATKHALSAQNFSSVWQTNKSSALQMLTIILKMMINPLTNHTILVLGGFAVLIAADWFLRRDRETNKHSLELILVLFLCTLLYQIGIACMYLLSMPAAEFFYQNGGDYFRYNSTMVGFLCGALLAHFGERNPSAVEETRASKASPWVLRAGVLAILLVCLVPSSQLKTLSPGYRTELETQIEQLQAAIQEQQVPSGGSYFVKALVEDVDFAGHLFRYQLFSDDVTTTTDPVDSAEIGEIASFYTAYINWGTDDFAIYTGTTEGE